MNRSKLQPDTNALAKSSNAVRSSTIRLTAAQALVKFLSAQLVETTDGSNTEPLFGGVFAIFGHGNVAGLGEALYQHRHVLPTYRAHNEQAMAHSAIAFAKAHFRRRMMAVTSSVGPGATNLVTAAALAHVNRLPVLLVPGDTFVSRAPDPVLQQLEDFQDGGISANDSLRPVSRYFDRIVHPAQLLTALPRAIKVLTDAALCGPVTLAMPQDIQATAFDYPTDFFVPRIVRPYAPSPVEQELRHAVEILLRAGRPLIVAGGGVLYSDASRTLQDFAHRFGIPVAETQAGKGALSWADPFNVGAIGVTGSPAANELAHAADCILAVGTRLQDFTTGSNTLFTKSVVIGINANGLDSIKHNGVTVQSDARQGLQALSSLLPGWKAETSWSARARELAQSWRARVDDLTNSDQANSTLPYDADVIGAVQRTTSNSSVDDIVVCAAGTLPAELHKLWRAGRPGSYHVEYGYSCMGYEIAGGLGAKLAHPEREVIVMVGDGSYLMLNSEIATSVMLGTKLIVVVLDNRGFGCINRLQQACGGVPFNNMFDDCLQGSPGAPQIDFAAHARSLGAHAEHVRDIRSLEAALQRARASDRTYVVSIDTDDKRTTNDGGWWWEVAIPEVSALDSVRQARDEYEDHVARREPNIGSFDQ